MATSDDLLRVLTAIDAKLVHIVSACGRTQAAPSPTPAAADMASDADLDGPYGDPQIRAKDPRDWKGEPQKGKRMSQCPAEYLDLVASRLEYFAGQETDEKKAHYTRKDAGRARGWAARIRAGYRPITADEIPFGEETQAF